MKSAQKSARPRPDIYIFVLDTARYDHVQSSGYHRNTTPFISAWADTHAVVYKNAYSTSGWTSAAHASLFTGQYAISHGTTQEKWSLANQHTTLAEILKKNGYRTVGIVENPMLSKALGFAQGFDAFHQTWYRGKGKHEATLRRFKKEINATRQNQPLFAFVNLINPHSPYDSAEQFTGAYSRNDRSVLVENHWKDHFVQRKSFSKGDIEHLVNRYDEEIRYCDFAMEQMIGEIGKRGKAPAPLVVMGSDHGESFLEHNLLDHVFSLYQEVVRIPLMVSFGSEYKANEVSAPVQIHDVFPTALRAAGVSPEGLNNEGIALPRSDSDSRSPRALFIEYYKPKQAFGCFSPVDAKNALLKMYDRRIKAVVSGDWKLIWYSDTPSELYNLRLDPKEQNNLADAPEGRIKYGELHDTLALFVESHGSQDMCGSEHEPTGSQPTDIVLDEATRAALKKLGYLH